MKLVRTTATDPDFVTLVTALDAYLTVTDGDEHDFYDQYNQLDDIPHALVAYVGNTPVACGAFKPFDRTTVEIKRMYCTPEHRGKGLASAILRQLESWAGEEGYQSTVLETGTRQTEAVAFYESRGYTLTENYGQYRGVANSRCYRKSLQ